MLIGWHLSNAESGVSAADWRVLEACPPGCVTFLPDHGAKPEDIRRLLDIAPDCHCIMRPYYVPSRNETADLFGEWTRYADECLRFCDDYAPYIPEGQRHLQVFNEPNMPRWAQWEGFGDQLADMQLFNEAFGETYLRIHEARADWAIGFTPLTPGNRDARFAGDPDGHYYLHGPGEAAATGPCREALALADELYVHAYLDSRGDTTPMAAAYASWLGLRHETYVRYLPKPMDVWITEAGFLHRQSIDMMTMRHWLHNLSVPAASPVRGVCLWILGDTKDWGRHWHENGQPIREVYELAEWAQEHAEEPAQPTLRILINDQVQALDVETYVKGVVPAEMYTTWPMDALRAQAVAARSYALAKRGRHAAQGADLCATSHCQNYRPDRRTTRTDQAVDDTADIVAMQRGRVVPTYYSASCGGTTLGDWGAHLRARADCPCQMTHGGVYGHQRGLCQWGAWWLATQGLGWRDVLRFYYRDIVLEEDNAG